MSQSTITTHYQKLSNATIFYRKAGLPTNPTILLLHGFPNSSHIFRNMIPILSKNYHVVAPDFPAFGFTTTETGYEWTFANLASTLGSFLDALHIERFSMYIFDYGAPIGLRLALSRPEAVTALITQNGNAYMEGLGNVLLPITKYWETGSQADRDVVRDLMLSFQSTKSAYEIGTPNPDSIAPESWWLDYVLLCRDPETHLDLLKNYETNVQLYPKFQEWFRETQIPTLVVWGRNDIHFVPAGAEAFKKDLPKAEVHLLDAGHCAAETNPEEIGALIVQFFKKNNI